MNGRADLERAIALLTEHQSQLGDTSGMGLAVATALAVLREDLAVTPGDTTAPPPEEQRKQVTILFAALDGVAMALLAVPDAERPRLVSQLWQRLDDTVTFHGGVVDKHIGDVVMGVFGVPVARENDPEQAVRCALAMEQAARRFLEELDGDHLPSEATRRPPIRIGVNTGHVVLGRVGTDDSQTVIGDPVNVASRLKDAGEGGVFISHETNRLVDHVVRTEPLGLFPVKGRQTPVSVYRVEGLRPRATYGSRGVRGVTVPMVGRAAELERLQLILQETIRTNRGRFVTIIGEAGVGKSRLLAEFHRWLDAFPVRTAVLQGRTDQRMQLTPYSLMRDAFVSYLGINDSDSPAVVEQKLAAGLSAARPSGRRAERERGRSLGRLLGLDLPPLPDDRGREGSSALESGSLDLIGFLGGLSARYPAVVLVFEDIHWADEDSLDLLERLAQLAPHGPNLVISLARPTLLERRPTWLAVGGGVPDRRDIEPSLWLQPLEEEDARELVGHILHKMDDIPEELVDLIVRSSGGNPYFVEELIKVLIEDGLIAAGEDQWEFRAGQWPQLRSRLRVPATLTGVLQARLDRLPDLERATLQQAAVIGEEFWDSVVQQMNRESRQPFTAELVQGALTALEGRDFVHRTTTAFEGAQAYRFKHAILREVAYDSVLLRDRPGYHLSAARWLETTSGDRAAEVAAPIGEHYERAGRVFQAATAYQSAGVRAEELANATGAIGFYRRALALLGDRPQHIELRLSTLDRVGRVLIRAGRLVEAAAVSDQLRRTAELDGNLLFQARAEIRLSTLAGLWRRADEMRAWAASAGRIAWLTGAPRERLRASLLEAEAAVMQGQPEEALRLAEEALALARESGSDREMAEALGRLGMALFGAGREGDAMAVAERLADMGAEARDAGRPEAVTALRLAGRLLARPGSAGLAHDLWSEARDLCGEDSAAEAELFLDSGELALAAGQWALAETAFGNALLRARASGDQLLSWRCELGLTEAELAAGRDEAFAARLRLLLKQLDQSDGVGPWPERVEARALLALALDHGGLTAEALIEAEAALTEALHSPSPLATVAAWTALGRVLASREDGAGGVVVAGGEKLDAALCFRRVLEQSAALEPGPMQTYRRAEALAAARVLAAANGEAAEAESLAAELAALRAGWVVEQTKSRPGAAGVGYV